MVTHEQTNERTNRRVSGLAPGGLRKNFKQQWELDNPSPPSTYPVRSQCRAQAPHSMSMNVFNASDSVCLPKVLATHTLCLYVLTSSCVHLKNSCHPTKPLYRTPTLLTRFRPAQDPRGIKDTFRILVDGLTVYRIGCCSKQLVLAVPPTMYTPENSTPLQCNMRPNARERPRTIPNKHMPSTSYLKSPAPSTPWCKAC